MNARTAAIFLVILGASRLWADDVDPSNLEPADAFEVKLKAFSAAPTVRALKDLNLECLRIPVRELKPGQIGSGHPGDREAKLRCMLDFIAVLDRLTIDNLPVVYMNMAVPGVPIAGMNPGDVEDPVVREKYIQALKVNESNAQIVNFQIPLQRTRKTWATHYVPRFFNDDCTPADRKRLLPVIADALKDDPRAKDLQDTLMAKGNAS